MSIEQQRCRLTRIPTRMSYRSDLSPRHSTNHIIPPLRRRCGQPVGQRRKWMDTQNLCSAHWIIREGFTRQYFTSLPNTAHNMTSSWAGKASASYTPKDARRRRRGHVEFRHALNVDRLVLHDTSNCGQALVRQNSRKIKNPFLRPPHTTTTTT